ncbi:MAG: hypothetical protein RMJ07_06725 [Nitrososphaerota archaeon]|nr:hypothetical protein [Candidatus Bathyarchaeota archaeon]MDW8049348.1 hypothetical protein [Nitrososphaerota archaeon]
MVYFVVYRSSESLKERVEIAQKLRMLECRRICRSFWQVENEKISDVMRVLRKNSPIILKRIREKRKPRFDKDGISIDLGSLVIVAYHFPKDVNKGQIGNLLRASPCIRLCRGVYAFSQFQDILDGDRSLVDARSFLDLIRRIDENAIMIPRVVVVNEQSVQRMLGDVRKRIEREIDAIIEGYNDLIARVRNGEIDEQLAKKIRRKFKRRFILVKKLASFYKEWMGIDFAYALMRPYAAIRKVRLIADSK